MVTSAPLGGGPFQSGGGPYFLCPLVCEMGYPVRFIRSTSLGSVGGIPSSSSDKVRVCWLGDMTSGVLLLAAIVCRKQGRVTGVIGLLGEGEGNLVGGVWKLC